MLRAGHVRKRRGAEALWETVYYTVSSGGLLFVQGRQACHDGSGSRCCFVLCWKNTKEVAEGDT